jgi:acetylornithine deacetylase/succinyl-diaminopimelate desuccinylase-like protein
MVGNSTADLNGDGDTNDPGESLFSDALEDPGLARWIHACTHMTVSPNVLRAGANINVVPASAEAGIDIRMLPGQVAADLDAHLDAVLGEDLGKGLTIEEIESTEATATPPEGPLWEAVGDALRAVVGPVPLLPVMTPVATDARFFRRRGTRAYGFTVSDDRVGFADHLAMFHGHDERISEGTLRLTTDHLLATVQRFGELTRP